jgi:hypothetical protein
MKMNLAVSPETLATFVVQSIWSDEVDSADSW